jgi:predicted RNA-binding protein with PUA-like domain
MARGEPNVSLHPSTDKHDMCNCGAIAFGWTGATDGRPKRMMFEVRKGDWHTMYCSNCLIVLEGLIHIARGGTADG